MDFLFYDFLFTMIFKDSTKINKKEKDKTIFKTAYTQVRKIKHTISKVKEGGLSTLEFRERKRTFAKVGLFLN